MNNSSPYLPYILKDVVSEVDGVFSSRSEDPFNVFFDYGLYVDVSRNIYKKGSEGIEVANIYPLIWLVDNWSVQRGNTDFYGAATFELIIAMPTDKDYTSDQRSDIVFIPRLFPIYDELIKRLGKTRSFVVQSSDKIQHRVDKRSYWGGSEGGSDTKNLFGSYIDALHIPSMTITMNNLKC